MMNNKSLVAKWISQCEKDRKAICKNTLCKECKYYDICPQLMFIDTVFKIRGYID